MLSTLVSCVFATAASGCLPGGTCPSDVTSEAVESLLQQQVRDRRRTEQVEGHMPGFIPDSLKALFSHSSSSSRSRGKSDAGSIPAASADSAGIHEAKSSSVEAPPAAAGVAAVQEAANTDDARRVAETRKPSKKPEEVDLPDITEAFQEVQGTVAQLHEGHDRTLHELEETTVKMEAQYKALSNVVEEEKQTTINVTLEKQAKLSQLVQDVHKIERINAKLYEQDTELGKELRRDVAMIRTYLRRLRLEQDGVEATLNASENVTTGVKVLVAEEIKPKLADLLGKMQGAAALIQSSIPVSSGDHAGYSVSQPLPHLDSLLTGVFTKAYVADETAMQAEANFTKNHIGFALSEVETLLNEATTALENEGALRANLSTARDQMYIAVDMFREHSKSLREFCSGLKAQVRVFLSANETPSNTSDMSLLQDGAGVSDKLENSSSPNLKDPENYKLKATWENSPDDVSAIERTANADFDEAKTFYLKRKQDYTVITDGLQAQVDQLEGIISAQKIEQQKNQKKLDWATALSEKLKDDFASKSEYLRTVHNKLAVVDRFLVGTLEDPDFVRAVWVANHVLESTLDRPFKLWDPTNTTNGTVADLSTPDLPMPASDLAGAGYHMDIDLGKPKTPETSAGLLQIRDTVGEPEPVVDMLAAIEALEASEATAKAKLQSAMDKKMAGYHVKIKLLVKETMGLEQDMAEQNLKYNKMLVYHIELNNNIGNLKTELEGVAKFAEDMVDLIDHGVQ